MPATGRRCFATSPMQSSGRSGSWRKTAASIGTCASRRSNRWLRTASGAASKRSMQRSTGPRALRRMSRRTGTCALPRRTPCSTFRARATARCWKTWRPAVRMGRPFLRNAMCGGRFPEGTRRQSGVTVSTTHGISMRPKRSRGGRSAGLKEDTEDLTGEAFEDAPAPYARAAPKIGRNDPACAAAGRSTRSAVCRSKTRKSCRARRGGNPSHRSQSRGHPVRVAHYAP